MSNEAQVVSSLVVRAGKIIYNQPHSFTADMTGRKGPVPGAMAVSTTGTDVDFSQLTTPALCRLCNLSETNYVEFGIADPETGRFYPLGEILPGESYVLRLSRNLQEEYSTGTGTGSVGPNTNRLRLRANAAECNVQVEAFEA